MITKIHTTRKLEKLIKNSYGQTVLKRRACLANGMRLFFTLTEKRWDFKTKDCMNSVGGCRITKVWKPCPSWN